MQKVQQGQRVGKPSASLHNTSVDVADHWKRKGPWKDSLPSHKQRNYSRVKVKNLTGGDLPSGSVVELDGFLLDNIETDYLWFEGKTPNAARIGWGVTVRAIPANAIDECLVLGVCPALVKIHDENHEYASRADGETVLHSSTTGPVKILYNPGPISEESELPEVRECVVQIMDEGGVKSKIVTPKFQLYAAFGGGHNANNNLDYQNADLNSLAISTGNYIPLSSGSTATARNRVTYPGKCYVWEYDANGILQRTGEEIDCINITGLPIMGGTWCIARQVSGIDDYWVATKIGEFSNAAKHFECSGSSLVIDGTEAKIERGEFVPKPEGTATDAQDWVHVYNGDVFIHHPGTYTITFGAEVKHHNSFSADDTTWTDSNGDTLDLPNPVSCEVDLLKNWNPTGVGAGDLLGAWSDATTIKFCIPARSTKFVSGERTVTVNHTLDTWHGQPYLRLNIAVKVTEAFGSSSTTVLLRKSWIHIRPEGGGQAGGNEGTGYNVFLGTSGAFQWWGGGSAPVDFDEDGIQI